MTECIITSSVLIFVVIALRFLFRGKISCRLQYALWVLVLMRLLMPFSLFASSFSVMNLVPDSGLGEKQVYILPISTQPANEISENLDNSTDTILDPNSFGYTVLSEDKKAITRYAEKMSTGKILSFVWLIGGIVVGLWFITVNFMVYKQLRKTQKTYRIPDCKLPVYISEHIGSPCLFGLLHPAVYLTPKAVESEERIRHVLAHELCHYRHGDHIWSLLRGLCLSMWWWNPLVWVAAVLSRADSELACDESVIQSIGEDNRLIYARILVDMIAAKKTPASFMCTATTMSFGKRGIKERLNMIVRKPKTIIPAMVAVILAVAFCLGCTFTGAQNNSEQLEKNKQLDINNTTAQAEYALMKLGKEGEILCTNSPLSGSDSQLANDIVMNYMIQSATWPGTDVKTLNECYLLRMTFSDGTTADYYAYLLDGRAVMQTEADGYYSYIDNNLYKKLVKLAQSSTLASNASRLDKKNLEACISDAVLSTNGNQYPSSDFATEAHTILKTVENGNTTTVYAMVLYAKFDYTSNKLSETGGSHMPSVITFEKNDAGEYMLKTYWVPQDGSYYAPSIKEKFPSDIYTDALDTQKYVVAQIQSCYAQAIEYGKVDTAANLAAMLETICSSPAESSNPKAYIDAHLIEYREMVYYGSHTLRYCFTQFEQGSQTGLKGHIMASVCRDILGKTEDIDQLTLTGQDWYDAFKESAKDQRRQNGDDFMKKKMPGSWLLLQMLDAAAN